MNIHHWHWQWWGVLMYWFLFIHSGRVGLLDEAYDFIKSMPFEPHSGVWGALLGASRIMVKDDVSLFLSGDRSHRNFEEKEWVAEVFIFL
ncbi:hypothetical protein L1987_47567 [Smallanthus sonchifolius]|uniref:Uncharacterized protein n=1 Tax=Smallanthus sonchifolius TaxID=185202 RepID=A0ACB9G2Z6_9ASTR|nr:hypothetical protein L1987_47567 [Smallanthus sonchifolius]